MQLRTFIFASIMVMLYGCSRKPIYVVVTHKTSFPMVIEAYKAKNENHKYNLSTHTIDMHDEIEVGDSLLIDPENLNILVW